MVKFLDEQIFAEVEMWRSIPMPTPDQKRPCLVVPKEKAEHKLQIQIERGRLILSSLKSARTGSDLSLENRFKKREEDQKKWAKYAIDLLKSLFSDDSPAKEFGDHWIHYSLHGDQIDELASWMNDRIGRLESIRERLPLFKEASQETAILLPANDGAAESKDVFIVHGHDAAAKFEVARFLEKLGLNPIILHELADGGRTIIEKFEANANVGFAVILLTPDDVGHPKDNASKITPRARQNVILELGFFLGKLGRHRVCALKKGDIELPTDYSGVLFKPLDEQGAWKLELAKEIKRAGMEVDLNKSI
jgi:predicted nucleotide-binding protein